jgi:hypothetical protein
VLPVTHGLGTLCFKPDLESRYGSRGNKVAILEF